DNSPTSAGTRRALRGSRPVAARANPSARASRTSPGRRAAVPRSRPRARGSRVPHDERRVVSVDCHIAAGPLTARGLNMPGACAGVRGLDCSEPAAGSLAAMVLADFGADVIRIDAPGAAPRTATPSDFLLHRGKRSITLDLESAAARTELHRLLPGID